jgi:hypothetical protein
MLWAPVIDTATVNAPVPERATLVFVPPSIAKLTTLALEVVLWFHESLKTAITPAPVSNQPWTSSGRVGGVSDVQPTGEEERRYCTPVFVVMDCGAEIPVSERTCTGADDWTGVEVPRFTEYETSLVPDVELRAQAPLSDMLTGVPPSYQRLSCGIGVAVACPSAEVALASRTTWNWVTTDVVTASGEVSLVTFNTATRPLEATAVWGPPLME